MPTLTQQETKSKPTILNAWIYNPEGLLVDIRNVTEYSWERMARFAQDMDNCGRSYVIRAVPNLSRV